MIRHASYPIAKDSLVLALRELAAALEAGAELDGFSVYRDARGVHRVEARLVCAPVSELQLVATEAAKAELGKGDNQ